MLVLISAALLASSQSTPVAGIVVKRTITGYLPGTAPPWSADEQPWIEITSGDDGCRTIVSGKALSDAGILAAHGWRRRSVDVMVGVDIPYACIERTTATLRRAGIRGIGLVPKPDMVRVSATSDGACEVQWEGMPVDHELLAVLAATVPDKQAPVEIKTAADTPFRCLGAVVYRLQKAGLNRLGFIAGPPANRR